MCFHMFVCVCVRPHPLGEVKCRNPQRPEAAEHGEDGQAQVVSWGDHYEVVLTLTVAGAVCLHKEEQLMSKHTFFMSSDMAASKHPSNKRTHFILDYVQVQLANLNKHHTVN